MSRPIKWQSKLREIERQVRESPRTPYSREAIGKLFGLNKRQAQRLTELMRRHTVGRDAVVERIDLLTFLEGARAAADLGAWLHAQRLDPPKPVRAKLRVFVPRDFEPGNLASLSPRIRKRRGELTLLYETAEELVSLLLQLSSVVELPEFERRFCRPGTTPAATTEDREEMDRILADLEDLETEYAAGKPPLS